MKRHENLNVLNRIISLLLLSLDLAVAIFSIVQVISSKPEGIVLDLIALIGLSLFCLFEMIVISLGKKKDSVLQKIAFTETEKVNNFPLIMVIIATIFGLGLTILGIYVYIIKDDINIKTDILVILSIGFFLFVNCLIYYIYLIMFRKREFKMEDLIK